MSEKIKIIVATHKKSPMPNDKMYLPLHVGAIDKYTEDGKPVDFGYMRDDFGDNISELNQRFGTQTGLYWEWKNLNAEYKGLVHYRRYFTGKNKNKNDIPESAITYDEIEPMLGKYKVFVPKKRLYVIETLYTHYVHTHDERHLKVVQKIIAKDSPEYLHAFDTTMNQRWGYMFNMMILRSDLMDNYCTWLFNILFQTIEEIDISGMNDFDSRYGGRISELLLNVWIQRQLETGNIIGKEIKELPYIEDVNWGFKMKSFFLAKYLNKKYQKSS